MIRTVVIDHQHPRFIARLVLLHRLGDRILAAVLFDSNVDLTTFVVDSRHQGVFRDIR